MALQKTGRTLDFKFTDSDGDEGIWRFTPAELESDRKSISDRSVHINYETDDKGRVKVGEIEDYGRREKAACVVRTVSVSGEAFTLVEDYVSPVNNKVYKAPELMPLADEDYEVRDRCIDDLVPAWLITEATDFLSSKERPMTVEDQKSFRGSVGHSHAPKVLEIEPKARPRKD